MKPMLFSVYGFSDSGLTSVLATFFDNSSATRFAMHPEEFGAERRNLYIAEPRYDRRVSGYRPALPASGYREWLASLDAGEGLTECAGDPLLRRNAA